MNPLVAVMTCNRPEFRQRAEAQRATWASPLYPGVDIRFFNGRGRLGAPQEDEVWLDAPDDYDGFAIKVRAAIRWAYDAGYEWMFKTDDDIYIALNRLLSSGYEQYDYSGRLRNASGKKPAAYCSGLGYWISRRSMKIILDAVWDGDTAEDRHVGNVLYSAGIIGRADYRYAVARSGKNAVTATEGPREGNSLIAVGEYDPESMAKVHRAFRQEFSTQPPPRASGALSNVAVMIKTFLRDGYLYKAIDGIEKTMPEVKIVVVDDGHGCKFKTSFYARLIQQGHSVVILPFDSGFGAKANAALPFLDRQYVLIGSDDFNFTDKNARIGVSRLAHVLEHDKEISVASGRVNERAYEHLLTRERDAVTERRGYYETRTAPQSVRYHLTDLTVNYSLIRRSILDVDKIHWDGGAVKIGGGEHGAFFLDLKEAGYKVALVEGANVNEFADNPFCYDIAYQQYRSRAKDVSGRPCLKVRGVNRWQLADGTWENT